MFIGSYRFDGDPAALVAGYDRMLATYPPDSLLLNLCVVHDGGITVYDACPTVHDFVEFSTGPDFAAACRAAGLPVPVVERLGELRTVNVGQGLG